MIWYCVVDGRCYVVDSRCTGASVASGRQRHMESVSVSQPSCRKVCRDVLLFIAVYIELFLVA